MSTQIPRGATTNVVFNHEATGSPYPTSPYFMGFPAGWSGSLATGDYNDPNITVAVTVPANAALGNAGSFGVGLNNTVGNEGKDFRTDIEVIKGPCTCVLTTEPTAGQVSEGRYTLMVTLKQEGCQEPLDDIVWSPEPDSGQGTMTATYQDCELGSSYSGTVSATDADDCEALADFVFMIPIGGSDPPC